jgi:hypothetical protein
MKSHVAFGAIALLFFTGVEAAAPTGSGQDGEARADGGCLMRPAAAVTFRS